jgi:hypothetical protein
MEFIARNNTKTAELFVPVVQLFLFPRSRPEGQTFAVLVCSGSIIQTAELSNGQTYLHIRQEEGHFRQMTGPDCFPGYRINLKGQGGFFAESLPTGLREMNDSTRHGRSQRLCGYSFTNALQKLLLEMRWLVGSWDCDGYHHIGLWRSRVLQLLARLRRNLRVLARIILRAASLRVNTSS